MKKIVLFVCSALVIGVSSQAQISKGSISLGGNIGFGKGEQKNLQTNQETDVSSTLFNPTIGVAVKENFVAGISFTYAKSEYQQPFSDAITKNETTGGGVFVRQYLPVAKKLYLYGEAGLAYMTGSSELTYTGSGYYTKTENNEVQLNLTPGISYNVYKALYLEMAFSNLVRLGYEKEKMIQRNGGFGPEQRSEAKGFSLQAGTGGTSYFSVGLRFIIP